MLLKQFSHEVKDLDESKGIVKAYANAYDNIDSDGDISVKGSFSRSVNNNWKRMRVLKDHDTKISLGIPIEADTKDNYGLLTTTQFFMHKSFARDMFLDIKMMMEAQNPLNPELSIGYEIVSRDQKDKRKITEYKLMEYSFLTSWAANELATVQDVKSIKTHYGIMELITKMYDVPYSDERLKSIELTLQSLTKQDPSESATLENDPIELELIKSTLKNIFKNHGNRN